MKDGCELAMQKCGKGRAGFLGVQIKCAKPGEHKTEWLSVEGMPISGFISVVYRFAPSWQLYSGFLSPWSSVSLPVNV